MTDKTALIQPDRDQPAVTIHLVDKDGLDAFRKTLTTAQRSAADAQKFAADASTHAVLTDGDGWAIAAGVASVNAMSAWCLARLAEALPAGTYRLAGVEAGAALFGWITAQYRFDRYRSDPDAVGPRILLTRQVAAIDAALAEAAATALVRDLVNTPGEDMGPAQLEDEVRALAKVHGGEITTPSAAPPRAPTRRA